ncbi:nucleotidyltransferase-like protein [Kribbella sp. VKM Ac-2571]|uniref:nucleotidyltransferase domain-containing protein n=1 Tax=Kribbella sp. VKM Ac-2571 TaxID=2512222 RepID=UPI0010608104|nr:nucleotidyltransferase domain-containing protein [Kribbella sp. VKM Ac-2571]TDO44747.1 nucleotidyltransferase-like protein [Kribbella sp. VKM Ac-2571]
MDLARQLVLELYPEARAAWLGGSVVRGDASPTSDLDITVLLDGPPAPRRKSLEYGGWPVELFVHTEKSLRYFADKDQLRRQPTMMRLVGESVVLVDTDGSGARLQQEFVAEVAAGPKPLSTDELDLLRYTVTDLLEDLSAAEGDVRLAITSVLWQEAARLLLTGAGHWSGTGKGLLREVTAYDVVHGTDHAGRLLDGVRASDDRLIAEVHRILVAYGGPLFAGFELTAHLDR